MKSVRHKINKFRKDYPNAIIRSYNDDDYNGLIELQQYWTETSGKKYREVFDMQSYKKLIENHDKLDHFILVGKIDNELVGMITGGVNPQGEVWSYFIKAKMDLKGLSETLIIELAHKFRQLDPNFQFSNVGSDMGPKGLREFKRKFDPPYSFRRYRIRPGRNFSQVTTFLTSQSSAGLVVCPNRCICINNRHYYPGYGRLPIRPYGEPRRGDHL